MRDRGLASLGVLVGLIAVASPHGRTQPRTPWGDPDLSGVWNFATMTSLERPRELAANDILTGDEAAVFERQTRERRDATNNTAGPDWWDAGTIQYEFTADDPTTWTSPWTRRFP